MEKNMTKVLDKGYVRLVDVMGTDLSVVNSARVSYNRESDELNDKDVGLINFLAREDHTSPFRHATMQFEVYAPLLVARQWWKQIIGSSHQEPMTAWNESSRRYITEESEFYVPAKGQWRSVPENSKQGSGEPVDAALGEVFTNQLMRVAEEGQALYDLAMKSGICAEQARLFLPANGMYVRWYWTASLQGVSHFLYQRDAPDAQMEIQQYAKVIRKYAEEHFPVSIKALTK